MPRKIFTDTDKERLRDTDMEAILRAHGKDTSHTAGFLYKSPFREDNNPSFHIDHKNHRWADHGAVDPKTRKPNQKVTGGDTFDLVMRLRDCSFIEALEYLNTFHPEVYASESEVIDTRHRTPSKIVIEKEASSFYSGLMNYASDTRGISERLVSRYCRQLTFHLERGEEKSRSYFALGFPSTKGTWEIRNKYFKLSTGKAASIIDSNGNSQVQGDVRPTHDSVVVFEGFMNFLSYLQDKGMLVPDCDVVVLNSVSMLDSVLDFIMAHREVTGYLDNDATGKNYTAYLKERCGEKDIRFNDGSRLYSSVNDYNDYLLKRREKAHSSGRRSYPYTKKRK